MGGDLLNPLKYVGASARIFAKNNCCLLNRRTLPAPEVPQVFRTLNPGKMGGATGETVCDAGLTGSLGILGGGRVQDCQDWRG